MRRRVRLPHHAGSLFSVGTTVRGSRRECCSDGVAGNCRHFILKRLENHGMSTGATANATFEKIVGEFKVVFRSKGLTPPSLARETVLDALARARIA